MDDSTFFVMITPFESRTAQYNNMTKQEWKNALEEFINSCINNKTTLTGFRESENPFRIVAFQNGYIVTESTESKYKIDLYALLFDAILEGVIENNINGVKIETPKMFAEIIEKSPSKRISQSSTNGAYTKYYFGIYKEFLKSITHFPTI